MKATLILAAAAMLAAVPAQAREWPDAGGWSIQEEDGYCTASLDYEGKGSTSLVIAKRLDGDAIVALTNTGWSAKKDVNYDLTFELDGHSWGGGTTTGIGDYSSKGFMSKFGPDFVTAFAAASGLRIYMGETLVDNLSLKGSGAALGMVDRCLAALRRQKAAADAEKARFAAIADDPFATAGPTSPSGDVVHLVTSDDYPPSAIRAGEQGLTAVELTINATGRVEGCRVTTSSGSTALDEATCRTITRRGRFQPATDDKGKPTAGTMTSVIKWTLP